jgi:hypothetical protein
MQQRHATYQQWCDASTGLNLNDGRTVDQRIDRRQDKDLRYQAGL